MSSAAASAFFCAAAAAAFAAFSSAVSVSEEDGEAGAGGAGAAGAAVGELGEGSTGRGGTDGGSGGRGGGGFGKTRGGGGCLAEGEKWFWSERRSCLFSSFFIVSSLPQSELQGTQKKDQIILPEIYDDVGNRS